MKRMWLFLLLTACAAALAAPAHAADITVTWTAPGDDGNVGTAAAYELRYSAGRISERTWSSATVVPGVPKPSPAGTVQSFVITNVDPGRKMYLAIRSVDDAGNWSPVSNNAVCANCNCVDRRGNVDNDPYDNVTVADLTELVAYIFGGQTAVPCMLEANFNGDPQETVNITDLNMLVDYLYRDSESNQPAPCP